MQLQRLQERQEALAFWAQGSTFQDFQTCNLAFIRGLLKQSPYHFGSLDEESSIIIDDLYQMNLQGFITVDSQPYIEWKEDDKTVIQYPYVFFFTKLANISKVHNLDDNNVTVTVTYLPLEHDFYNSGGTTIVFHETFKGNQLVEKLERDMNEQQVRSVANGILDAMPRYDKKLVFVTVSSKQKSNEIFKLLQN